MLLWPPKVASTSVVTVFLKPTQGLWPGSLPSDTCLDFVLLSEEGLSDSLPGHSGPPLVPPHLVLCQPLTLLLFILINLFSCPLPQNTHKIAAHGANRVSVHHPRAWEGLAHDPPVPQGTQGGRDSRSREGRGTKLYHIGAWLS